MSHPTARTKGLQQTTFPETLGKTTAAKMAPITLSSAHSPHSVLSEDEQQLAGVSQATVSNDSQDELLSKFNNLLTKALNKPHNKLLISCLRR